MRERRTLAIPAHNEQGIRALGVGAGDEALHLADAARVGSPGERVGGQRGGVLDALDGDVLGAKVGFQAVGGGRAADGAHVADFGGSAGEEHDDVAAAAVGELGGGASHAVSQLALFDGVDGAGCGEGREGEGEDGFNGQEHFEGGCEVVRREAEW